MDLSNKNLALTCQENYPIKLHYRHEKNPIVDSTGVYIRYHYY